MPNFIPGYMYNIYQGTSDANLYFAAVHDLRKEIKTEENPAYATTLQVSLHTDNSIPARFVYMCLLTSDYYW